MRGTIEKRGGNSYRIQVSLGRQADGTYGKVRETVKGKSRAEARLAELLTELNRGEYVAKSKTTLKELSSRWLRSVSNELEPSTVTFYETCMRTYVFPKIGHLHLEDIQPLTVRTLLDEKPSVAWHVRAALSACLTFAVDMNMIRTNPCKSVRLKYKHKRSRLRREDVWNAEEVQKFLEACRGEWYEVYFQTALNTGMRQSEILALRWSNVKGNTIAVVEAIKDRRSKQRGVTKTPASTRTIEIGPSLQSILRAHKAKQNAHRLKHSSAYINQDLVVANRLGKPADSRNMLRAMKRIAKKASVPYIPPKNLRHTHASLLLEAGVNPKIVQERLGHEDVTLTLNTYSFALENMQEKAVEDFEKLFTQEN